MEIKINGNAFGEHMGIIGVLYAQHWEGIFPNKSGRLDWLCEKIDALLAIKKL